MVKVYYSLYDRMLRCQGLAAAFQRVRSAKGAAGIDGQSINDFAKDLQLNLTMLINELRDKSYRPLPVRRVEIPKPEGGVRKLGIPAVRDRVVQQALLNILQPIFDEGFHPSSYGYRPGRSCHQAISKASMFIRRYEMKWVVDMDLSKCFDTLDHEIIIASFRQRVVDGSILRLLRMFLESGVMTDAGWESNEIGSPQGGVISPLIANVYLDYFDQFMKSRNYRIVRYADDILILTRSKSAAENALQVAGKFLENELKLTVNERKTRIVHSDSGVSYLGVVIHTGYTRIHDDKVKRFKERVKLISRRNTSLTLEQVIKALNPVMRGFANYFRIANCKGVFARLMAWLRRRLRAKQMKLWKRPKRLHRRLRQLGYSGDFQAIKMSSWRNAGSPLCHLALPNKHFVELDLFDLCSVQIGISVST